MTSVLHSPTQPRRTNSLGRAKSPCENCKSANILCDRARPMCLMCTSKSTTCSGYKMNLRWEPGVASKGNLAGFKYTVPSHIQVSSSVHENTINKKRRWRGKTSKVTGDRHFKFVDSSLEGKKGRKTKTVLNDLPIEAENSARSRAEELSLELQDNLEAQNISSDSPSFLLNFPGDKDIDLNSRVYSEEPSNEANEMTRMRSGHNQTHFHYSKAPSPYPLNLDLEEDPDEQDVLFNSNDYSQVSIPTNIYSISFVQGYDEILSCYDQYICAIPLTADCFLNPFRVSSQKYMVSQHLLHAIMATSLFHLNRQNESSDSMNLVDSHRSRSLGLYSAALGSHAWQENVVAFLDTALLLMYLDSAQSALGLYHVHLQGVRSIIESSGGGSSLIPNNSKLRAELAMFIWYDTTIALLAREDHVLPLSYLESILRHGHLDGWSYLELTGCLEEFVVIMAKIASLAQQYETAREKENLYFDISAVDEVEQTLRRIPVPYPPFEGQLDEESLDLLRDRYHCIEAWRNALLIYIERVFRWTRGEPAPSSAKYLARSIMDHARCIRRENNFQKQILLPVFLAGAEVRREEDRDFVRDYCSWWTRLCGSKMFIDASSFCEEIWNKTDKAENRGIWWGSIIDKRCLESKLPIRPQILLG